MSRLRRLWRLLRQLSGDDAYERYLRHQASHHPGQPCLGKAEFFRQWQDRQWRGIRRCC